MQIIVVGCGNVGRTLVEQLSQEGHQITIIDTNGQRVKDLSEKYDILGIIGNGASYADQLEAGVAKADLLIAVTGKDELNLLCCLIAKKAGGCHTIARVSDPVYSREIAFIKEELGLSMVINPKLAAAAEISRLLRFPAALEIDTFAKGRVELVKFRIEEGSQLCGMQLKDISSKLKSEVLICAVERGEDVTIPDGNFILEEKDDITIVGSVAKIVGFFKKLGIPTTSAKDTLIIGGGETSYYLAEMLISTGIQVKIVEVDKERCSHLSEMLPQAMVIWGDGTDRDLLMEEGLERAGSIVTMTNVDEENIMLSLFAKTQSKGKIITKVHRIAYDELIASLDVGSVIYPKYITSEAIIKYVRAMSNTVGSNIETLYRLNDNRIEALEFYIREDSPVVGVPLMELKLKPGILLCSINHKGVISIPGGKSVIQVGDTVVLVTTMTGIQDIKDILR